MGILVSYFEINSIQYIHLNFKLKFFLVIKITNIKPLKNACTDILILLIGIFL